MHSHNRHFRSWLSLMLALLMGLSLLPAGALAMEKTSGSCPVGGAHEWHGEYDPEPWCTTTGTIWWNCGKCDQFEQETVPALGHDWGPWTTLIEATCTTDGQQARVCNRCGEREFGAIPALGHDWHEETISEQPPTCTDDGFLNYHYVCSRCGETGDTLTNPLPALGHDWGGWKTDKAPTCLEDGKRHHTCNRCGLTQNGTIGALGHDWDEGVVTRIPTPEKPGERTFTCKRDPSHTYTEPIPYDGEPIVAPPVTEPDPSEVKLILTAMKTGPSKTVYHEGDPISYHLTLTNAGDEDVEAPYIAVYWVEESTAVTAFSESTLVLHPGESFEVDKSDSIVHQDVLNGQVTFDYTGMATRISDGSTIYSGTATLSWPTEDTEPDPVEPHYELGLTVNKVYDKAEYVVDGLGYTEEIPYKATVTNLSDVPIHFSDLRIGLNGTIAIHIEPVQYLMPNDSYSFQINGTLLHETQVKPGTGTEDTLGIVTMSFEAVGHDPVGGEIVCTSNTVNLDHTLKEIGPWEPPTTSVSVEKVEISAPLNPKGYMLNETISYDIYVTNTSLLPISKLEVHDDLFDNGSDSDVIAEIHDLQPADTAAVTFSYTVTQADVDAGFVLNTASATWMDLTTDTDKKEVGVPVRSPTTAEPLPGGLTLVKSVTSTPDNDLYYTPGETIRFHFVATNTMDTDLADVLIYDSFFNSTYLPVLKAHDTYEWDLDYVATEPDADLGYVTNVAYGGGFDPYHVWKYAISNEVTVPVHRHPPKTAALLLTKVELSKPANGLYYVVGEDIDYTITAENIGETVIYDVCLFDSLDNPPVEYAHFGILNPGEAMSATYTYTVTQADVDTGYVENWAIADYSVYEDDGSTVSTYSTYAGPVYSPCNAKYVIQKKTLPGKADSCVLTLKGAGKHTLNEEQHYCGIHKKVAVQVEVLIATAKSDTEKAAAWQEAAGLWRAALDAEYAELMEAAKGDIRLSLMEEQAAFDKFTGEMVVMLQALYPENGILVYRTLCGVLERQCTELCYLHSNAGKARPDSLLSSSWNLIENDEAAAECSLKKSQMHTANTMFLRTLCETHGRIQDTEIGLAKGIVNRADAGETFRRIRRLWQTDLDQATNTKYLATDGDARMAVSRFRVSFDKLLEKHTDLLDRLYPDNPEIVAEVIGHMIRNLTLVLCSIW